MKPPSILSLALLVCSCVHSPQPTPSSEIFITVGRYLLQRASEAPEGSYLLVVDETDNGFATERVIRQATASGLPPQLGDALLTLPETSWPLTLAERQLRPISMKALFEIFKDGPSGWEQFYLQFPGSRGYLEFSQPAIIGDEAAIFVDYQCHGDCGGGYIFWLKRNAGEWSVSGFYSTYVS